MGYGARAQEEGRDGDGKDLNVHVRGDCEGGDVVVGGQEVGIRRVDEGGKGGDIPD